MIAHVTSLISPKLEDATRYNFAKSTWQYLYEKGVIPLQLTTEDLGRSSSSLSNNTRDLPYLNDLFDYAFEVKGADIIIFSNSDICFVKEAAEIINEGLRNNDAIYSARHNFNEDFTQKLGAEDLSRPRQEWGIDMFAFKKSWWMKWRKFYPDCLIGCFRWDMVLQFLVNLTNRTPEVTNLIYHRNHNSFWLEKENYISEAGQLFNDNQLAEIHHKIQIADYLYRMTNVKNPSDEEIRQKYFDILFQVRELNFRGKSVWDIFQTTPVKSFSNARFRFYENKCAELSEIFQRDIRLDNFKRYHKIEPFIHFVWLGQNPIPAHLQSNIDGWTKNNPGCEVFVWKDEHFKDFELVVDGTMDKQKDYNQMSNLLRLEVLRRFGGVYADLDVYSRKSIKPLLFEKSFFAPIQNPEKQQLINCVIGSHSNHPLIKEILAKTLREQTPESYQKFLDERSAESKTPACRILDETLWGRPEVLLPQEAFCSLVWDERNNKFFNPPESAYGVHQWENSWLVKGRMEGFNAREKCPKMF